MIAISVINGTEKVPDLIFSAKIVSFAAKIKSKKIENDGFTKKESKMQSLWPNNE